MSEPCLDEHVIAHKMPSAGRVRVHGWRRTRYREDTIEAMTDCGLTPEFTRAWLWVEYRTLNSKAAVLCRKCWLEEET